MRTLRTNRSRERRAVSGGEPLTLERPDGGGDRAGVRASRVKLRRAPWRVLAARVVVNGIAVALVVLILPGVRESTGHPALGYLALGAIFGLINAFVKPDFRKRRTTGMKEGNERVLRRRSSESRRPRPCVGVP